MLVLSKTPTVDATPDYSDGDVIGGKQTLGVQDPYAPGGLIKSACVYSKVDIAANIPIRVILFNQDPSASTFTENSAPTIHANDLAKIIGVLDLSQRLDLGTPVVLFADKPNLPFVVPIGGSSLYGVAIAGGTINLAADGDLTFVYGIREE